MCGIFGVVGEPREPSARLQAGVIDALRHRGPDGDGAERFDGGWMAHTRLAIIDLSASGRQPMRNARGTTWMTYNGEIYNYRELRQELSDYPFRTHTDTEVILAAYDRWGLVCLERLRGMFAFGLWDAARRTLLCATDRFSIKPLYYAMDGGRFLFSSEVKALARAGLALQPNEAALHDYLVFGLLDHGEETLFEGVQQLRPGSFLTYADGRLSVNRYWDLRDAAAKETVSPEHAVAEKLRESVRLHLRGDVEVGLSLSSGLDSNVLQALACEAQPERPLQCFTYAFSGTPYDEWARNPSGRLHAGVQCRAVEITPDGFLKGLRQLITTMEGPVGGLGIYGYWRNAELASSCGIKVLLDGQGADELFAGYRYYYKEKLQQRWERGEREAARDEHAQLQRVHGETSQPFETWMAAQTKDTLVLAPDGTALTSDYVAPAFAGRFLTRRSDWPEPSRCAVKNAMYRDLFLLKIPKLLRFQDRCAMAWGVEVRVPFLDHELAELLFSAPTDTLLEGGLTKSLMRRIAAGLLPAERLHIPKLYVSTPQREWIKTVLREPLEAMIDTSALAAAGFIDPEVLRAQYRAYVAQPALGNSFFIWKFLNLELWWDAFFGASRN